MFRRNLQLHNKTFPLTPFEILLLIHIHNPLVILFQIELDGLPVGEEGWASLKDSPERWRSELAKSKRSQGEPGAGSVQEPMESSAGLS